MRSQELRKIAPELDSLRLGTGWKAEDLAKPQIFRGVQRTGDRAYFSGGGNLETESK